MAQVNRVKTATSFVDVRIENMAAKPGMWGSHEAVECQVIGLIEFEALMICEAKWTEELVFDWWNRFTANAPLHKSCPEKDFGAALLKVSKLVRAAVCDDLKRSP